MVTTCSKENSVPKLKYELFYGKLKQYKRDSQSMCLPQCRIYRSTTAPHSRSYSFQKTLASFEPFHQFFLMPCSKNTINLKFPNSLKVKLDQSTLDARVSCSGLPVAAERTEENNLILLKSDTCIVETDLIKNSLTWALWLFAVFAALGLF